ncbi:MAG: class I SAM-dependent methyltransferase, partial [Candidatus Micrarchaeia archaeon]
MASKNKEQLSKEVYESREFVEKYYEASKRDLFHLYEDKPAMHKIIGNVRDKRVLCIGCGTGNECSFMKKKGAKEVIGTDISRSMVDIARKLHKNIEFYVMSAAKLDFESGKFDLVYADLVLHYLKDMGPAMKEAYRVLKPGGRFIFSNTHPIYDTLVRKNEGPNTHSELFGYINRNGKYEVIGDYFKQGIKGSEWFKRHVVKFYPKTFSHLIMDSLNAGFVIKSVLEPEP